MHDIYDAPTVRSTHGEGRPGAHHSLPRWDSERVWEARALAAPAPVFGTSLPRGFKDRSYVRMAPHTVNYIFPSTAAMRMCALKESLPVSTLPTCASRSCGRASTRCRSPYAREDTTNYAGFSTTEGLLIDLGQMRSVAVDDDTGIATVQVGARNTDVYESLQPHEAAISAGRCPTVAIGGLVLGGGSASVPASSG